MTPIDIPQCDATTTIYPAEEVFCRLPLGHPLPHIEFGDDYRICWPNTDIISETTNNEEGTSA